MPIEYMLLKDMPAPRKACPFCDATPFTPFLRGIIQRPKQAHWYWHLMGKSRPYCALICTQCKQIVGWEEP